MKKHDEGYVMILVLVVMIVMGLVTASILTFSLRNLQNQQLSIERMADKYAAQGMIEEYLSNPPQANGETQDVRAVQLLNVDGEYFTAALTEKTVPQGQARAGEVSAVIAQITAKHGSVVISCQAEITGTQITGSVDEGYTITDPATTYASYKITYSTGETEEGGGAT